MLTEDIRSELFRLRDEKFGAFQSRLIPTVAPDSFIGVRTPDLRSYAKRLSKEGDLSGFLSDLPHRYFDENQLHAFILSGIGDFGRCIDGLQRFLPFVDNWATCDQLSPRAFRKHRPELLEYIYGWLASEHIYTVRFGIGMLMAHFLDGDFDLRFPERVAQIRSGEYYINMMIAWYFATALAKQYKAVLPFIEERRLDAWTHNRAIQKSLESRRISDERKAFLRGLKVPAGRHGG